MYSPQPSDFSEAAYAALIAAVTMARVDRVQKVAILRGRLRDAGHTKEAIDEALTFWANYSKER